VKMWLVASGFLRLLYVHIQDTF